MMITRKTLAMAVLVSLTMTLIAGPGCSKKKAVVNKGTRFSSLEQLADHVCKNAHEGNSDAIIESFISKKEYIEKIYPQTPEGKSKRHLSGEDFWRIFVERQRVSDAMYQAREYKGRIESVTGVGVPKQMIVAGNYTFLHRVPVNLEITGESGRTESVVDDNLLGVVIQEGTEYRLFNVFK
jgi:hypothetical protein